jgi:hypothetical protein
MLDTILSNLEKMTPEQKATLLATEFSADLEKEASATLDMATLADAVYTYGYLCAERGLAEADGLDKVAAENIAAHEQAVQETEEAIDSLVESLGISTVEDEAELHKHAQGLAQFMFAGYSDCIDKVAGVDGKKALGSIKKMMHSAKGHLAKHSKGAVKAVRGMAAGGMKRHGNALAGGAAAGAAAGYFGKKHMDKKASELTAADLITDVAEGIVMIQAEAQATNAVVDAGVEKLAGEGMQKALAFGKKHLAGAKAAAKKHGPGALVGAAAGAGAGAALAHHKKD